MCDHANDAEARRCQCTGYGMGDLPCRCGRGKSLHQDGTGRCVDAAARCHEFVPSMAEPLVITDQHITAAARAILRESGETASADGARRYAVAALMAGRLSVQGRDAELERVRRHRDRLRDEVAALTKEVENRHTGTVQPMAGLGADQYWG